MMALVVGRFCGVLAASRFHRVASKVGCHLSRPDVGTGREAVEHRHICGRERAGTVRGLVLQNSILPLQVGK